MPGKVFLVGAGPGDPGLITVKGLRCLQQADVVVYDRLMDPALLQSASPQAELVFVGKERGRQALTQDEINDLLLKKASAGNTVVRLKGGDPFVFGRGGEEAQVLARNGMPFEVVPGITSAIAAAAYAGIPVTQRRMATCFTVVSGSEDPSKPESSIPWDVLARTGGTLVVLMGWAALQSILETLQREGMAPDTPVALVQWGTWKKQQTVDGTLDDVVARAKEAGLAPPVVAIIGPVAGLRNELRWFDRQPLFGKKVLITRSRTQSSRLRTLLDEQGAESLELPSIEIAPPDDFSELDRILAQYGLLPLETPFGTISKFWMIFSSANSVDAVFARLDNYGQDSRVFADSTIGAIGPATAAALAQRGIRADFVPTTSVSEAVLNELSEREWYGVPVLLPGADIGRDVLARGLADLGARIERVTAYRTVTPDDAATNARQLLTQGVDVITFTSSSTVRNLMDILDGDKSLLEPSLIACIGPVTAGTAKELVLRVDLESDEHT
ncbi:MAG: uroporphyrinogen-III C-methyltransferase, partial [Chloroflexi bacterium]|nr:uroporphyrinogen-III C-methyltransferase [Chloroflexota bacterium]